MSSNTVQHAKGPGVTRRNVLVKGGVAAAAVAGATVLTASNASAAPFAPVLLPFGPIRIYDSRPADRLYSGWELLLYGDPIPEDLAYLLNVTVTATTGSGWLSVYPADTVYQGTSTVNWSGPEQTVANNAYTSLRPDDRGIIIRADGGGSAHFVVDLLGILTPVDLALLNPASTSSAQGPDRTYRMVSAAR